MPVGKLQARCSAMSKNAVARTLSTRMRKIYRYAYNQIKVSLPSEIKRENKEAEFCLVVAGAHKVGSTWAYRMIKELNLFREWPVPIAYRSDRKNHALIGLHNSGVDEYFRKTKGLRLYKSHSEPPNWDLRDKVKFVTVIRDPRDMVISNIFYLANLSPELGGWPELRDLPVNERIKTYLKKGVFDLELLEKWTAYTPSYKVHYERLLESPATVIKQLFEHVGLNVPDVECQRIVKNTAFAKLSGGRKTGEEDSTSFFRKGVAGDWRNYFGEEELECFKTEYNGGWNKLLVRLGYERTHDWQ